MVSSASTAEPKIFCNGAELWIVTRSTSESTWVNTAPTVGPSITHMPPAITANTMLSETPSPAIVSGPIYIWYCA